MTFEQLIPLIIMAFALGMDGFSVSLGMGMMPLKLRQILYIGMTIGIFHIIMPFIGMVLGRFYQRNMEISHILRVLFY